MWWCHNYKKFKKCRFITILYCGLFAYMYYILSRQGSVLFCQVDLSYFMHVRYVCMCSIMYKCTMYNVHTLSHTVSLILIKPALLLPFEWENTYFKEKELAFPSRSEMRVRRFIHKFISEPYTSSLFSVNCFILLNFRLRFTSFFWCMLSWLTAELFYFCRLCKIAK